MKRVVFKYLVITSLIVSASFASCHKKNGDDNIDNEEKIVAVDYHKTLNRGYYQANAQNEGYTASFVVDQNTITIISDFELYPPLTIRNVYTFGGGAIKASDYVPGCWAYIYKDNEKIGYICKYTQSGRTVYGLGAGLRAKSNQSNFETGFETTQDFTGVADYPSFSAFIP